MTISIKNKKKIIAVVTAVTVWGSAIAPVFAITAAELQTQIDALMAQLSSLQTQLSGLEGGGTPAVTGCTITSFTRSLKQGMSGDDVKCLQIVLNSDTATKLADSGVGSPGNETSYLGPLTKAAVIKFQEKYASEILASWGLTAGTGFVGSTTRTKLNSMLGTGGVVTPPVDGEVGTAAMVSLAADTPVAAQVALNSQDVLLTKIKFTAGADAYTITKLVISRGGVSADADVSSIKLYDGATQVGSTQALNTTTHKATFSSLSWNIPSYSVKYLTLKASIAAMGTATVGDSIQLGISSASDITSTVTPSGVFPMMGKSKTLAGITVGELFVVKRTSPATTTILSGSTDQEIACWTFQSTTSEGFNVNSIKVSHVGTAARGDVSNLMLKVAGAQIGSTVASLDAQNTATFDLSSSPLNIIGGASKAVCAYTDVADGIWTSRTIIFEITQYLDVVAYGSNSGGLVSVSRTDTAAFTRQTGNRMTIGQGALTIALDAAQNPSSQNYVKGTTNRMITAVKFSTASTEGARITKLRFTLLGITTDISNITLWDGTTQIAGPASAIGTYVTFGANTIGWDTTGLFDVPAAQTKTILVKGDIPAGAGANNTVALSIAASADVWADGLNSQYDLSSGSITGSASSTSHTVTAMGTLAVSKSANTPSAQTYVKGEANKVFTKINLTAGAGEDIIVSSIIIKCENADNDDCLTGYIANVKILKSDGTQFGSTISAPVATASFSGSLIVTAAQTETISVVADIPTASNATSVHLDITTASSDITSTGNSSAADIDETGSATGNTITVGSGSLTISAAATPGDQTLIIGSTEVPVLGLVMTAGTGEDIRVTRIILRRTCKTGTSCAAGDSSSMALWEGSTRLTAKKGWDSSNTTNTTFSASDFLNSSGIDLTKGQQKTIVVKVDLPSTAISGNYFAIGLATSSDPTGFAETTTTDVTIVGLSSNTNPAPTVIKAATDLEGVNYSPTLGSANAYHVAVFNKGTLVMDTTADTPVEAIQSVSVEGVQVPGVVFHKSYFKATLEEIDIKTISVTRQGGTGQDSEFASVSLYEGTTLLAGPQSLANGSTTFSFPAGSYWRIPTAGARYLTIKATLNGIRSVAGFGSETGDAPRLGVDTVTAEGASSGLSPNNVGVLDKIGNPQILRQSQPTIALSSPTSGTYGAGTKELIKWTVTADSGFDIGWKKVVFDMSGGIVIGTTSYTVGSAPDLGSTYRRDGIYMSTSTTAGGAVPTQLIATTSMQVWDVDTNTEISATSSATDWTVDQGSATGTARVAFVAATEQVVAAGTTKTYKFIGTILRSGLAGSAIMTQIASRSTSATSTVYNTAVGTARSTSATFVWTDRSGASTSAGHTSISADWTDDYKVTGIPTATKSLSK